MRTELINVTDEELLLLSEGELSAAERSDLFLRLDMHPTQWRTCALGLLESRALDGVLQELRNEVSNEFLHKAVASSDQCESRSQSTRVHQLRRRVASIAAMAACLIMALGTGLWIGKSQNLRVAAESEDPNQPMHFEDQKTTGSLADVEVQKKVERILDHLNIGDEQLLAIVEVDANGKRNHVPVINSQTLTKFVTRHPVAALPAAEIRAANRMGWHLTQEHQLLAIERADAKVQVVPIGFTRLKSVGRDLF